MFVKIVGKGMARMNIVKALEINKQTTYARAHLFFKGCLSRDEVLRKVSLITKTASFELDIEEIEHEDESGEIIINRISVG